MTTKPPPHNIQAEQAVICGILVDNRIIEQVRPTVAPDDFYDQRHQVIIDHLYQLGTDADIVTLTHQLKKAGKFEETGKLFLGDLAVKAAESVTPTTGVKYWARIIRDLSVRRKLIAECSRLSESCFSLTDDLPDLFQTHETALRTIEIGSAQRYRRGVHLSNVYTPERMLEAYKDHVKGLKKNRFITGIYEIDSRIRGVAGGEVLAVIARAGSFKTAWLQNMLRNYIHHSAWGAVFFEIEMPVASIAERYHEIIQGTTGRDIEQFYTSDLQGSDVYREALEKEFTEDLNRLYTVPTKVSLSDIAKYVNIIEREYKTKIGVIGIDYIGLMDGQGKGEYEITSNLANGIKQLAKELDLPIIYLSQLSRKGGAGSTEVELDMGRGSGAIEEGADFVFGTWQDNEDLICKILKNRKGPKNSRWKLELQSSNLRIGAEAVKWEPKKLKSNGIESPQGFTG